MDEHSKISPSGFKRMMLCPGSVQISEYAPLKPPSIYAERGTLQHEAVVMRWRGKSLDSLKLDEAETNNVDDAIDYLKEVTDGGAHMLNFEVRGDLSHIGYPEIWGTRDVDLRFLKDDNGISELHVIDWKFGSGVAVEVDDNPQLLGYLLMALTGSVEHNADKYFIHLAQPPKSYYGVQEVTHEEIGHFTDDLTSAIESTKGTAALIPGEEQCRFCPAAMSCRARKDHATEMAGEVFEHLQTKSTKPHTVTADENSRMFTMLTELMAYHAELGKHGFAELINGRDFPGYKLVGGRSTRKWVNEKAALGWLKKYSDVKDCYAKPKMLSPAQVEKKDRSLKKDEDFRELIDKPKGKPKMVPEDDKRMEINVDDLAADAFKNL